MQNITKEDPERGEIGVVWSHNGEAGERSHVYSQALQRMKKGDEFFSGKKIVFRRI